LIDARTAIALFVLLKEFVDLSPQKFIVLGTLVHRTLLSLIKGAGGNAQHAQQDNHLKLDLMLLNKQITHLSRYRPVWETSALRAGRQFFVLGTALTGESPLAVLLGFFLPAAGCPPAGYCR